MSEQNLSQWFDLAEQKPWEVGVYEVEDSWGCIWMCRWNGEKFLAQAKNAGIANLQTHSATICIRRWRGLSTNPDVKKKQGDKRVTRYVVMTSVSSTPNHGQLLAVFSTEELAKKYADRESPAHFYPLEVHKIRFRTPE